MMKNMTVKDLAICALMAALTFIFTYTFKVPVYNGYIHLGDCFIFLGVLVLGRQKGSIAGGMGAALADLIGGYVIWIVPTFFIKAVMAYIMGTIVEVLMKDIKFNYVVGSALGGMVQIVLYTAVNAFLYGGAYAITSCLSDTVQTSAGVAIGCLLIPLLRKTAVFKY